MSAVDVSAEEEAEIKAAHVWAEKHDAVWATQGDRLTRAYGGQWVAFRGSEIVAHSADAADLQRQLAGLAVDRSSLLIRFIPPGDRDFAF